MSMSDGFEQYRILLKELSRSKVDYKKLKNGVKDWLKSLSNAPCSKHASRVNKKFLERLQCKGFTYNQLDSLVSKVVITGDHSVLWNRIVRVIKFESQHISGKQTLRDIVIRLINTHKSLVTTTGKIQRKILIAKFVGLLGLLLVIFYAVNPRNIMDGGFIPLSRYIDSNVPEFKVEGTTTCDQLWTAFWNDFYTNFRYSYELRVTRLDDLVNAGCISEYCKTLWLEFLNCYYSSQGCDNDIGFELEDNGCFKE